MKLKDEVQNLKSSNVEAEAANALVFFEEIVNE